jgi:hypothetical protein
LADRGSTMVRACNRVLYDYAPRRSHCLTSPCLSDSPGQGRAEGRLSYAIKKAHPTPSHSNDSSYRQPNPPFSPGLVASVDSIDSTCSSKHDGLSDWHCWVVSSYYSDRGARRAPEGHFFSLLCVICSACIGLLSLLLKPRVLRSSLLSSISPTWFRCRAPRTAARVS